MLHPWLCTSLPISTYIRLNQKGPDQYLGYLQQSNPTVATTRHCGQMGEGDYTPSLLLSRYVGGSIRSPFYSPPHRSQGSVLGFPDGFRHCPTTRDDTGRGHT